MILDKELYISMVREMFPKANEFNLRLLSQDTFHRYNVTYHSCDEKWLKKYILDRVYTDFCDSVVTSDIHDFLETDDFKQIVSDFQNLLVSYYIAWQIDRLDERSIKVNGVANTVNTIVNTTIINMSNFYNMDKDVLEQITYDKRPELYVTLKRKIQNRGLEL